MRADVIDISHYQQVTDGFAGAKAMGIVGVIAKATEGHSLNDAAFETHRGMARRAGLLFGAYHFLRPGDMYDQADHFLQVVGDPRGMLLALDHEDARVSLNEAQAFMMRVKEKTGAYPVLYSGALIKQQVAAVNFSAHASPDSSIFWGKVRLWVAQYGTALHWPRDVWPQWWLWQYTGDGAGPGPHDVPGVGTGIDISTFYGTPEQLRKVWATVPAAGGSVQGSPPVKQAPLAWWQQLLNWFLKR